MKTLLISVQVDNVTAKDLAKIEELVDKALEEYKQKRISYNLTDMFGPPIPA